ncbi:hypothetical protein LVD15_17615 [Fulvivirga maritima]|uniref:hypothetical protein n=1 Tax=Fulvivirga maritima TaxID=2904247 RepID=UPI001F2DC46A|nr:hypothetical protein [Fulvivirga maritima]UII25115.1 hypothetical protein LVD15_17615 [Fulvivirga maritima]
MAFDKLKYDEDIYYVSVFLHTDEESWRYEVYVNGDEVKPIFIEHLYRNERGAAKHYEKYSQYGYQTITYEWENSEAHPCHVEIKYYSLEHELIETRNYQVNYKDDIPHTIVDSEGHEIYSNDNFEKNIEELINEVKGLIIQSVRMTLEKKHSLFKGKIAFALFEYNIQGVFPPTLALASEEEAAAEEDPFSSYNAPDLQYFSERNEYEFDFYHKGTSKYSVLNKHIYEELEPDEGMALARSIYIDICKSTELQAIFEEYLDLAEDFHITAYDYDAFDLEVMLPLTLDENIWQKLSAKKQAYEEARPYLKNT